MPGRGEMVPGCCLRKRGHGSPFHKGRARRDIRSDNLYRHCRPANGPDRSSITLDQATARDPRLVSEPARSCQTNPVATRDETPTQNGSRLPTLVLFFESDPFHLSKKRFQELTIDDQCRQRIFPPPSDMKVAACKRRCHIFQP